MNKEKPKFSSDDLPLNQEQMQARETWMMEQANWREDHSVPSAGEHYRYMWKWDSTKAVIINAKRGDPERADTELTTLLNYVDPETGFLPNKIFASAEHKTWRDYPEALFFNNNKIGTSYSQPPLEAWAAMETYQSYLSQNQREKGLDFLRNIYGTAEPGNYTGLQGGYAYFLNHRQNSIDDPLLGIIHPNETGRDSDEANKPWLIDDKNSKLEWLKMQKFGWDLGRLGRDPEHKRIDWIPEKIRDKYWVNDVMFNSIHAHSLDKLADIADTLLRHGRDNTECENYKSDRDKYRNLAKKSEQAIIDKMWDNEDEFFYNLDKDGEKIPVESISGLFPLILDSLDIKQTESLLDKLESPLWFNTNYPIPTHATRSKFYRPNPEGLKNAFTPQWSGTVWTDMNHIIAEEGLVSKAEQFPELKNRLLGRAAIIATQTYDLLAGEPKTMEYYSPETGKGMRVSDFMWTNLGLHFEKTNQQ